MISGQSVRIYDLMKKNIKYFMTSKTKKYYHYHRWQWKENAYNWLFIILALGIAAFTELFYHQKSNSITEHHHEDESFPKFRPESISSIILQNKVHMLRLHRDNSGHWFSFNQEKNTKFPVREDFINGLVSTLSSLNLQKQFPNDSLNRANFSLNEPLVTLTITTAENKMIQMKVGISNPITKASYININESAKIFQIDMISNRILNFHQEQIFDDRIFSFNIAKLNSINFEWPQLPKKSILLAKGKQKWVNLLDVEIPTESVNSLLKVLRNIKSSKIIQSAVDEQTYQQAANTFTNPIFKISINFGSESYNFLGVKGYQREIASVIKSNDFFLVKETSRNEISVMSREDFNNLSLVLKNIK